MTDKDIKSLFDKLNPDEMQKQKAWNNILKNQKAKKSIRSTKRILLIAAIISISLIISVFTINAISGGELFKSLGQAVLGSGNPARANAVTYTKKSQKAKSASTSKKKKVKKSKKRKINKTNKKKTKKRKSNNHNSVSPKNDTVKSVETTEPQTEKAPIPLINPAQNPTPSAAANADETINPNEKIKGDYIYLPLTKTTASIAAYIGNEPRVIIPAEIDGYKITLIDNWAFTCKKNLAEVIVPEGVTAIGERAFYGSNNLNSVKLPSTLISIGARAFMSTSIRSIDIPDSVVTIGRGAFANCRRLADVKIGKGIKEIEKNAFNNSDIIIMRGYKNTAAYEYAINYDIKFISLETN